MLLYCSFVLSKVPDYFPCLEYLVLQSQILSKQNSWPIKTLTLRHVCIILMWIGYVLVSAPRDNFVIILISCSQKIFRNNFHLNRIKVFNEYTNVSHQNLKVTNSLKYFTVSSLPEYIFFYLWTFRIRTNFLKSTMESACILICSCSIENKA